MSDNRALFIEEAITGAVKQLLTGRVNELLGTIQYAIPVIEFGNYDSEGVVVPAVALGSCERTEKERIIKHDAYYLTIVLTLPETEDSELHCYAYAWAICKAVEENHTLNGVVDRAVVCGKKYMQPKKQNCGQKWDITITLRITVENLLPCRFST